MATDHWLWKFYRRFYAIHHKRPKVCRSAYRKGYWPVDNLWALVVVEDRSYYPPYLFSTVWIIWRWKIRQPIYSRDKSPAGLLLTSWQTLRTAVRRKKSKTSQAFIFIVSRGGLPRENSGRHSISYVHPCLESYSVKCVPQTFNWAESWLVTKSMQEYNLNLKLTLATPRLYQKYPLLRLQTTKQVVNRR